MFLSKKKNPDQVFFYPSEFIKNQFYPIGLSQIDFTWIIILPWFLPSVFLRSQIFVIFDEFFYSLFVLRRIFGG